MLKFLRKVPLHIVLILFSLSALVPIYFMGVSAFKSETEYYDNNYGIPIEPTLENFKILIIDREIYRPMINTLILTFSSTIIAILISIFASYAYAKMKFRGRDALFNITIAFTAMPAIVVIIPLYSLLSKIGLINSYLGASLVYAGFMLPISIFILTSFFITIENEILEAARIDGCSSFMILLKIIVPLSRPSIISLFIVNGLWVWNELLIALLLLQDNAKRTIVVELAMFIGKYSIYPTFIMTGAFFVGLPMIILYLFGQKYFVKGLTSGAIK
jgi:raffinose/stachyose/melibiose transport system permease protein